MPQPPTRISPISVSAEAQQQTAFYAGNPEHCHSYESPAPELTVRPKMRMRPSQSQTEELRNAYVINPHPTKEEREELGKKIGMYVISTWLAMSNDTNIALAFRRYQSVTNWFQNQRSLAKKRLDDEIAFEKTQHLNNDGHSLSDPSISYPQDVRALEMPVLPPRSSHPSVTALIRREKRSPSAERSNGSTSSRGSPYHSIIPSHRPRRTRPEPHQLEALQRLYSRTANPSIEERSALALEVGM
jgi:Homeodomain